MNATKRTHHGRTIDTSIRIKTTPMRAWEAWADPQQIANWFVDRAEGVAPGPQGHPYLMEITISKEQGDTVMRLVNSGFSADAKSDDEYEGVVSGWKMAMATMKQWLECYPNSRRAHHIVMEPATYSYDRLRPLFHTVDGRRRWLEPAVAADAEVLADTGREVLLAWDEHDAVVGLKAFRMGPQQMLALDVSTWSESPTELDAMDSALRAALRRLLQEI